MILSNQLFEYKLIKNFVKNGELFLLDLIEYNDAQKTWHKACLKEYKKYLKGKDITLKVTKLIPKGQCYDTGYKHINDMLIENEVEILKSPMWMLSLKDKKIKKFTTFYKYAIKELNLPFNKSYDEMNRKFDMKKLEKQNKFELIYSREQALNKLNYFIKEHFDLFGPYQDALINTKSSNINHHSGISHALNIGFLTPEETLKKVLSVDVRINSKEGFVRQLVWREYMKYIYDNLMEKYTIKEYFEKHNMFNANYKLSDWWYQNKKSSIDFLDDVLARFNKTKYNHHIERLMVLGNMFTMLEIHPYEVYKWFMQYIDAYDWVMLGNVIMCSHNEALYTKPYIASSNYIKKMSNYKRNDDFDILYQAWNTDHYEYLKSHGRYFARKYNVDKDKLNKVYKLFRQNLN